ncbi:MAG: hypothetical protein BGO92_03345 [Magnetospirillum sp. 64-120]|nr:MAG: hypothetical protein BGO92_03345 [Magnetospirillum sp. 64-120]
MRRHDRRVRGFGPIFLLIVLGRALRARRFLSDGFWAPAEKLTYYLRLPALLVTNLANAKLAGFLVTAGP